MKVNENSKPIPLNRRIARSCATALTGLFLGTALAVAGGDASKDLEVVRVLVQKEHQIILRPTPASR